MYAGAEMTLGDRRGRELGTRVSGIYSSHEPAKSEAGFRGKSKESRDKVPSTGTPDHCLVVPYVMTYLPFLAQGHPGCYVNLPPVSLCGGASNSLGRKPRVPKCQHGPLGWVHISI